MKKIDLSVVTVDSFLLKIFNAAKFISAGIMGVCLFVIIGALIYLLIGGSTSISVPDFDDLRETIEQSPKSSSTSSSDYSNLEKKKEIESEYGDDILDIMKTYKFNDEAYDGIIELLMDIDDEYRGKFVDGLEDFLDDAHDYITDKGKDAKIKIGDAANAYIAMFQNEIKRAHIAQLESKFQKKIALAVIGVALLVMLAFMLIPLLIQIEQNTRRFAAQSSESS